MTYFENATLQKFFDSAKLIIFDMNGLIIDDEGYQLLAYKKLLEQDRIDISRAQWISEHVGHTSETIFTDVYKKHGRTLNHNDAASMAKKKNEFYQKLIATAVHDAVCDGVRELIDVLHNAGIPLAVATSASAHEVEVILGDQGLRLKPYFDFILDKDNVTKRKPAPEAYMRTINHFGVSPAQTLVLEDTWMGVESAKSAGAMCIAVPNDFTRHMDFSKADLVISNLTRQAHIL